MTLKSRRVNRRKVRPISKGRSDVRREEFNRLIDTLNERGALLNRILEEQRIQFERIAQIQAELDLLKRRRVRPKLQD